MRPRGPDFHRGERPPSDHAGEPTSFEPRILQFRADRPHLDTTTSHHMPFEGDRSRPPRFDMDMPPFESNNRPRGPRPRFGSEHPPHPARRGGQHDPRMRGDVPATLLMDIKFPDDMERREMERRGEWRGGG